MKLRPDGFVTAIVLVVALASSLPAQGGVASALDIAASGGIALLFFLHGARLSREAIRAGIANWRLHALVLTATFVLFPLCGLGLAALLAPLLPDTLRMGLVFLACVPSTVQSSIAFTAIAKGNVAAAVAAAALSNVLGVVLTPALVALLISSSGSSGSSGSGGSSGPGSEGLGDALTTMRNVALQLLLPFALGQLARPWLRTFIERHARALALVDRGSILLVVYVSFSAAVVRGLWQTVSWGEMALLLAASAVLLGLIIALTTLGSRWLGMARADEVAIVFCGSKKSLATGVPIAQLVFPEALAGKALLPLMLFHQLQLMVMAFLAQRWARRPDRV